MSLKLPRLDKTMHVVTVEIYNPATGETLTGYGTPDPDFQRWWQSSAIRSDSAVSLTSLTYNGSASATYDADQIQGLMNKVHDICQALSGG